MLMAAIRASKVAAGGNGEDDDEEDGEGVATHAPRVQGRSMAHLLGDRVQRKDERPYRPSHKKKVANKALNGQTPLGRTAEEEEKEEEERPRQPRQMPVYNRSLVVEDEEDNDGSDRCVICRGKEKLLLCYGDRAPGADGGRADNAHHLCKTCLDKWFSAHNELRVANGQLPQSRHDCPVCRCVLRGSSLRSGSHILGLRKLNETWPVGERGPETKEGTAADGEGEEGEEELCSPITQSEQRAKPKADASAAAASREMMSPPPASEDGSVASVDGPFTMSGGSKKRQKFSHNSSGGEAYPKSDSEQSHASSAAMAAGRRSSRFDPSVEVRPGIPALPAHQDLAVKRALETEAAAPLSEAEARAAALRQMQQDAEAKAAEARAKRTALAEQKAKAAEAARLAQVEKERAETLAAAQAKVAAGDPDAALEYYAKALK